MPDGHGRVTQLLASYDQLDREGYDELFHLVYDDLRRLARHHLRRERSGHTLNTTALVHESYLKLVDPEGSSWQDRAHFLAVASKAMRHILIDYARRRSAQKRGGDQHRVTLDERLLAVESQAHTLLALDQALTKLSEKDARLGQVVECRYFGGMTVEETAAAVGVSVRTVHRDWERAKAYLTLMLREDSAADEG